MSFSLLAKYVSAQSGKMEIVCLRVAFADFPKRKDSEDSCDTCSFIKPRNVLAGHPSSDLCLLRPGADPYVKVWLMHKDKRVEKKKTVTMKRCLNPVFNESFPFDVPAHVLRETTIIITVMDKDRLSRNDVIGKASPRSAKGQRVEALLLSLPVSSKRRERQQRHLCDWLNSAAPSPLFQIYLSWKSGPGEVKHWKDMLARPRTNVAQWHALKA